MFISCQLSGETRRGCRKNDRWKSLVSDREEVSFEAPEKEEGEVC